MSKIKFGIVVFPGSNCDADAYNAIINDMQQEAVYLWHKETSLQNSDVIILPGGFSYGDYLRTGAIAKFSSIMNEVIRFAKSGGTVLGICNGFQILLETGLLPGAMLRNTSLQFSCKFVHLKVENTNTRFSSTCSHNEILKIPIAHGEGNYYTDTATLQELEEHQQILFRYCDSHGEVNEESNPNGSLLNIAGIINKEGNILGMMPHPERTTNEELGSTDGKKIFLSLIET